MTQTMNEVKESQEQCSVRDASREKWATPEALPLFLGAFSPSGIFLDWLKR